MLISCCARWRMDLPYKSATPYSVTTVLQLKRQWRAGKPSTRPGSQACRGYPVGGGFQEIHVRFPFNVMVKNRKSLSSSAD